VCPHPVIPASIRQTVSVPLWMRDCAGFRRVTTCVLLTVGSTKGGFATRREAQAFLTTALQRLGDGSYAQPSKLTLADFLTG
jgi:hypothetical protein